MARKPKAATKEAEVKAAEEVKVVEEPVAEVKEEVEEAPAKKTTKKAAKKSKVEEVKEEAPASEVKETVKKAPAKKAAKKGTEITLQFGDYTANMAVVEERVIAQFVAEGHKASKIKSLNIYLKPFENSAYYVINETETGRVDLF